MQLKINNGFEALHKLRTIGRYIILTISIDSSLNHVLCHFKPYLSILY